MAPASPSAVLAVSDRPLLERPEAKSTDGSDGQFAGLMAQFNHPPPPPPKAPESRPERQPRPEKTDQTMKVKPPEDRPMAKLSTADVPDRVRPKAEPRTQADPTPKAEPADVKAQPADVQAKPSKANPDPTNISTGVPTVPQEATGLEGVAEDLLQGSLAALVGATQATAVPTGTATVDGANPTPASVTLAATSNAKTLDSQAEPVAIPPTVAPAPILPKETAGTALPASPLPTAAPIDIKPEPMAQPDSDHLPTALMAQAGLAEPKAGSKESAISDGKKALDAPPQTDSTHPLDQGAKPLDASAFARSATTSLSPALAPATPSAKEQEVAFAVSKGTTKTTAEPVTLPAFDAMAAKVNFTPASPSSHAPDGSALAALGTVSRNQPEATPMVTAIATPSATPPTAPVLQVEGGVRWMLKGGVQEAQLQLHPDSLGQVTIHLRVEGGEVHARLWVTEPGSVQAVQEGRPHLEQSLKEQGLQLGSFDLQQGHRPFQEAPSTPTYREPSLAEAALTRQEAPLPSQPSILNSHHVELYA